MNGVGNQGEESVWATKNGSEEFGDSNTRRFAIIRKVVIRAKMALVMRVRTRESELCWHFHKKLSKSLEPREEPFVNTYISHQLTSCSIKVHLPLPLIYLFLFC